MTKFKKNDKVELTKRYRDRVINDGLWSIPLSILRGPHKVKDIYKNKNGTKWIYFGEKDINNRRIYANEKEIKKVR